MNNSNINKIHEKIFSIIDKNSKTFYILVGILCFLILVFSFIYFGSRVKFNEETNKYTSKIGKDVFEYNVKTDNIYTNSFLSDTDEIPLIKEQELSSLIFTEISHNEETENFNIQADIPKINISSDLNIKEFNKVKEKLNYINERIQMIRTVFEGNNELKFNYYAYYYQNSLSFGYEYYEKFQNNVISETDSFVYNVDKNRMMSFDEYLKSRQIRETKISAALREIIRREKLKYKYNKRNRNYSIEDDGSINLNIDNTTSINIRKV